MAIGTGEGDALRLFSPHLSSWVCLRRGTDAQLYPRVQKARQATHWLVQKEAVKRPLCAEKEAATPCAEREVCETLWMALTYEILFLGRTLGEVVNIP